jgi:hypothetical protein
MGWVIYIKARVAYTVQSLGVSRWIFFIGNFFLLIYSHFCGRVLLRRRSTYVWIYALFSLMPRIVSTWDPAKRCVFHPENGKKIYLQRRYLCTRYTASRRLENLYSHIFPCCWLHNAVPKGILSNGVVFVNNSVEMLLSKVVVAHFKCISRHLLEGLWRGTKHQI